MKRLFSWLFKSWLLSLLGVVMLSLLVWFEGPLFAFNGMVPFASSSVRWLFIWLFFAIWVGYFLWQAIAAKLASRRLLASLVPPKDSAGKDVQQQEVLQEQALLEKRLQQAMAVLRRAAPGKKKWSGRYLYQLPWYMFIGAPDSGKTTTLLHSGLKFPLTDALTSGVLDAPGGTRHCDWWFTDEAVLIDTAGRYITQDSPSGTDKIGWNGFLELLKKYRPRRPINGVIVVLSVADLLQQDSAGREKQALAIRARIKELYQCFGSRFPIYVTVTQCDLLAGFVEFFHAMGREERAQIWGMTFPVRAGDEVGEALSTFPDRFLELEQRLQVGVLERMQQERDLQRRALLYGFPQQFAAIGDVLGDFLNKVFQVTRYEDTAFLRGVYFTSGGQEGSPNNRGKAPLPAGGRSYFITTLLRELIFKESELAGTDRNFERSRQRMRWMAVGFAGLMLALAGTGLATSYFRNQQYVADVSARSFQLSRLAKTTSSQDSLIAMLPLLNAARQLPGGYAERDNSVPLLNRFGLSQAGKLGAEEQVLYLRLLRSVLIPRLVSRLEEVLRRGDANNQEYVYEALRVYLMLGKPQHLDIDSLQAWLDIDWRSNLPASSAGQRDQLAAHVATLFELSQDRAAPPALDAGLIAQTRLTLAMMPLPQRVYNRLKRQVGKVGLPEFSVNSAVGRDVSMLLSRASGLPLTRGVSGIYSVTGYRELLKQLPQAILDTTQDSWVLDRRESEGAVTAAASGQLRAAILQLYYLDYIKQWDSLLTDVGIMPFSSLDQGARITNALAATNSPLRSFLQAASKETKLNDVGGKSAVVAVEDAVRSKLAAARNKLESALGSNQEEVVTEAITNNPVDQHFEALHKLVGTPGMVGTAPIDALLAMLKDVSQYFDAAQSAQRAGTPPPPDEVMQHLTREADGKPAPLDGMLKNIDSIGVGLTLGSERTRLQSLWNSVAAPFCQEAIAGRYPMVRSATKEVTLDDFGRFFGPAGIMDDFFSKNLASLVDTGGPRWKWRNTDGARLGVPQDVLNQFQRAAQLRDMFFPAGGRQPSLHFGLTPLSVDPALSKVDFNIDGQAVSYSADVTSPTVQIALPSGKSDHEVHLYTTPALMADLQTTGPWAWFRMLDKGTLQSSQQGERFKLTYDLDGHKVVYQLNASSVINPFRRDALEKFRCPAGW